MIIIKIDEDNRLDFLPKHLGMAGIIFENYAYQFADLLSSAYEGGYWNFYDLDNQKHKNDTQAFFISPSTEKEYRCISMNGTVATFNAETFGIVITLFALNHLCNVHPSPLAVDKYYALRDYVLDYHEHKKEIAKFID